LTQPQQQPQHSPGSNELKAVDDKTSFAENDGGNIENETKSISSLRSGGSLQERYFLLAYFLSHKFSF
jgi:hypothetical protein